MARQNTMSVAATLCLVMLLAQAVVPTSAGPLLDGGMAPTGAPMSAPEMAPEGAPMHAPEMAPTAAPQMAPQMAPMSAPAVAPMAPPAYTPQASPVDAPTSAPGFDVMAPGPGPVESGAARNTVFSVAVVCVGFAAFLL